MEMKQIFVLNDIVTHVADALKIIGKDRFEIETFESRLHITVDEEDAMHVVDYLENNDYETVIIDHFNGLAKIAVDMED